MSRTVIVITNANLKIAATQGGLATAPDFQCQISSAAVNANANTQTVPATFCAGESQAPGQTGWELALTWLQDWTLVDVPVGPPPVLGLSKYAFDNDTKLVWFSLSVNTMTTPVCTGQAYVVAGSFGGDAGVPLTASAVWPLLAKPTITAATGTLLAAEGEAAEESTDESVLENAPA